MDARCAGMWLLGEQGSLQSLHSMNTTCYCASWDRENSCFASHVKTPVHLTMPHVQVLASWACSANAPPARCTACGTRAASTFRAPSVLSMT